MKQIAIFAILTAVTAAACKKNNPAAETQGVNFNRLLKIVEKDNLLNSTTTITYNYNNNNQLIYTTLQTTGGAGGINKTPETESFYRDANGRLDSAITVLNGEFAIIESSKTIFRYNTSGQLAVSIYRSGPQRDSCIYFYSGSRIQQRLDYTSNNGGAFTPLVQVNYSFDAAGNPTRIIFNWLSGTPRTDTLNITCDNSINPKPVDRFFFPYWTYIFFDDFTTLNNPLSLTMPDQGLRFTFEYRLTASNKPLYRKQTDLSVTPEKITETWYYYD